MAVPQLARAFAVARDVFEMRGFWAEVEALDNRIEAGTQLSMLIDGRRLVERVDALAGALAPARRAST